MKYYLVSFQKTENGCFQSNIAHAASVDAVNAHYSNCFWLNVSEASESDVIEAQNKNKPIVEIETNNSGTIADLLQEYRNNASEEKQPGAYYATYTPDEMHTIDEYKLLSVRDRYTLRTTDPEKNAVISALNEREQAAKAAYRDHETRARLTREYLRHNIKCEIRAAVLAAYAEIMPAFAGKAYGPKTADKIKEMFLDRTGCRVTFQGHTIAVYPSADVYGYCNNFNIELYTRYDDNAKKCADVVTPDNKIACLDIAVFEQGAEPVADIPGTIEKLLQAYSVAAEKYNALQAAISDYNALRVENIPRLYMRDSIYSDFRF